MANRSETRYCVAIGGKGFALYGRVVSPIVLATALIDRFMVEEQSNRFDKYS